MIVTREKFIDDLMLWMRKKLEKQLPEEDFEGAMMKASFEILTEHRKEYQNLTFP